MIKNASVVFLVCFIILFSECFLHANNSLANVEQLLSGENDVIVDNGDDYDGDIITTMAMQRLITHADDHNNDTSHAKLAWKYIQVCISFLGFLLNAVALAAFVFHGNGFTKELRILLAHQVTYYNHRTKMYKKSRDNLL